MHANGSVRLMHWAIKDDMSWMDETMKDVTSKEFGGFIKLRQCKNYYFPTLNGAFFLEFEGSVG